MIFLQQPPGPEDGEEGQREDPVVQVLPNHYRGGEADRRQEEKYLPGVQPPESLESRQRDGHEYEQGRGDHDIGRKLKVVRDLRADDAVHVHPGNIGAGDPEAPVDGCAKGCLAINEKDQAEDNEKRYGDPGEEGRRLLDVLMEVDDQKQQGYGDKGVLLEAYGDAD